MEAKFSLIGAGRVGSALAEALSYSGWQCEAIISRRPESARVLAQRIDALVAGHEFETLPENPSHLFLCTPDDGLPEVQRQLVKLSRRWHNAFVAHTSGAHSSLILQPLAAHGVVVASLHPAMSFSGSAGEWDRMIGGWFALEGNAAGQERGAAVLAALKARCIRLLPEQKTLYHIACVMAANYLVTLHAQAEKLFESIGATDGRALLQNLSQTVLENLAKKSPAEALTGPIARGDAGVIEAHVEWLKAQNPQLLSLYIELGKATLAVANKTGSLTEGVDQKIKSLFSRHDKQVS
jgi:predicted short-subunit dehydrogenase-like oxidoreductase (DUF2520 family)